MELKYKIQKQHHLYAHVFDSIQSLDEHLEKFTQTLVSRNPEALGYIKQIAWENTDHWNELFPQRIEMSSQLILSEEVKKNIQRIKVGLHK